ncbi:hypothetical protein Lal_00045654 [Lupinus albus]|nr:hypothetical protein Lal_00045654 [Lupinus albus]
MQNKEREHPRLGSDSFVIQIKSISSDNQEETLDQSPQPQTLHTNIPFVKFNFSAMKIFHRFRKVLMRLVFTIPSHRSSSSDHSRQRNSHDRFEPPKTSCSSYYSSYSHYNEAISDCIEFFNKSAQDGFSDGRKSDVLYFKHYHVCML